MYKTFSWSLLIAIFLLTVQLSEANRLKWNGGGGFNRWRHQTYKHVTNYNDRNNFNLDDEDITNFHQNSHQSENYYWYYESSSRIPSSETLTLNFSGTASETRCAIPTLGDSSTYEIRCIFPNSEQDEDCSLAASNSLSSGTSVILRCKPPFKNEQGDSLRVWVCEKGTWKGEFKAFVCIHTSYPTSITDLYSGGNIYNHNTKNENQNNYHFKTPYSSWNAEDKTGANSDHQQQMKIITETPLTSGSIVDSKENVNDKLLRSSTNNTTNQTTTKVPEWNSYINEKSVGNISIICPSLRKRTGVFLNCKSKSLVSSDLSSHILSQSDCSAPQVIGTEAFYSCEQYYESSVGLASRYRKCKEDGTWTGSGEDNRFTCILECGKLNPSGRKQPMAFTNGEPTYKAQWPWHAAIFLKSELKISYEYHCGATLINRRVVLTTADCVTESMSLTLRNITTFRIDLGRHQRTEEDEYVQTYSAEDIITHPSYNPSSADSNIAIIILKEKVSIGFHVRPICYPQNQNSAFNKLVGSYGTVVGFGTKENGEFTDTLHMARLEVVDESECADGFSADDAVILSNSTTFCAGLKNVTNVCNINSGGGMYFSLDDGDVPRWYLQGLKSVRIRTLDGSNSRCDDARFSLYTRVSSHADWIVRVLSEKDALF